MEGEDFFVASGRFLRAQPCVDLNVNSLEQEILVHIEFELLEKRS